MLANCLSLAIRVGGEVDVFNVFGGRSQLFDDLALSRNDCIMRGKVVVDIDA